MNDNLEVVQHFYAIDALERAVEILQDAGLSPEVDEETHCTDFDNGVYALRVPESELEEAEELLELSPTGNEGAMGMFADFERESDEVREAFRQV